LVPNTDNEIGNERRHLLPDSGIKCVTFRAIVERAFGVEPIALTKAAAYSLNISKSKQHGGH
jgi:hypothetical protein